MLAVRSIDNVTDLINLCRASRQFYSLTVPRLYLRIDLDLSTSSHCRLLRRLQKGESEVLNYFRALSIVKIIEGYLQPLFGLGLILPKLQNLRELNISNSVIFPGCVLNSIIKCATGVVTASKPPIATPGTSQPMHSALQSQDYRLLTHLGIRFINADQLYDNFKGNLVRLLSTNRALQSLKISAIFTSRREWPEKLPTVHNLKLPKLRHLTLHSETGLNILTPAELHYWGT